jgi:hypothetical protein
MRRPLGKRNKALAKKVAAKAASVKATSTKIAPAAVEEDVAVNLADSIAEPAEEFKAPSKKKKKKAKKKTSKKKPVKDQ